jgi:hypothetical protein
MPVKVWGAWLLVTGLVLVGCSGPLETGATAVPSPSAPLAAEPSLQATVAPSPTLGPTAAASPMVISAAWVILHTNDNWGETEPCG